MYLDLGEYLQELEIRPLGAAEAVDIRIAQVDFPDLRAYRDHLGVVRLCSPAANGRCDSIYLTHRSDDGGSLEILPYMTAKQVQVFADPPIYVVGQRNPQGFGEVPLPDWEALLGDAGLSLVVVSKVRQYFRQHQPVSY